MYRRSAQALRFLAVMFSIAAGLIPLLANIDRLKDYVDLSYGYLFAAVAGSCIAINQFLGLSKAWIRYMDTSMTLKSEGNEFQNNYARLLLENKGEDTLKLLDEILKFVKKTDELVLDETRKWAKAFEHDLALLAGSLKAKGSTDQTGKGKDK